MKNNEREVKELKARVKELERRFNRFREWVQKGPYGFNYRSLKFGEDGKVEGYRD